VRPSRLKPRRIRLGCVGIRFSRFLAQFDRLIEVVEGFPTRLALARDASFVVDG
jgi:hypothetical protein